MRPAINDYPDAVAGGDLHTARIIDVNGDRATLFVHHKSVNHRRRSNLQQSVKRQLMEPTGHNNWWSILPGALKEQPAVEADALYPGVPDSVRAIAQRVFEISIALNVKPSRPVRRHDASVSRD